MNRRYDNPPANHVLVLRAKRTDYTHYFTEIFTTADALHAFINAYPICVIEVTLHQLNPV